MNEDIKEKMKDLSFGICPLMTAQKVLSEKWALIILWLLSEKTMRFNELQRWLSDITQATLAKQLRTMEDNGLVIRTVYSQIPPKVEYSLSELGKEFVLVLEKLEGFGYKYIEHLENKKD